MKFKYKIETTLKISQDILIEKINTYLTNNSYRTTERGEEYIIFVEDEFSDRRKSRSDFHARIGEGRFVLKYITEHETSVELTYLTSVSYYPILVVLASAFGIYTSNIIMPIVFSVALLMPVLYKIIYLNEHVFKEIIEC